MDKVIVNNQIVSMRKYVKQAKTHMINKFVKQVKSLEIKKGNDTQITKNKRKLERCIEKVKILKQMKVDFVSKSALSKSKDWKSLIEQKNVSLQDQCLALLANYSSVQKEVEKFYSDHSILADKIPSLIVEWEIKYQKNKNNKKSAKKKFSKNKIVTVNSKEKNEMKLEEKIQEHISAPEPENNLSMKLIEESTLTNFSELCDDVKTPSVNSKNNLNDISSFSKLLNERKELQIQQSRDPTNDSEYQTHLNQFHLKADSLSVEAQPNSNCQSSIFQKLSAIANSNPELPKPKQKAFSNTNYQQTKSITFLDLNKIKDLNEIPVENASILKDETELLVKPKKDSFFISSDGNSETDSEKESNNKRNNNNNQDMSRRGSFNKITFSRTNESFSRRKDFGKLSSQYKNSSLSGSMKFETGKHHKTNKSLFKHETSKRNRLPLYQKDNKKSPQKQNQQIKFPSAQKEKSSEPLHPSWEAKRKLKECAKTVFKGKRILFDD